MPLLTLNTQSTEFTLYPRKLHLLLPLTQEATLASSSWCKFTQLKGNHLQESKTQSQGFKVNLQQPQASWQQQQAFEVAGVREPEVPHGELPCSAIFLTCTMNTVQSSVIKDTINVHGYSVEISFMWSMVNKMQEIIMYHTMKCFLVSDAILMCSIFSVLIYDVFEEIFIVF